MPENGMPGPVCDLSSVREAVCIHTHKIFDSCRDKDCVEDLRFYPTASAQEVLSACQMVRGGTAELLYVYTDVEPVTFNRGFYSIDMRFFYRVTLQVGTGTPRCTEAEGLCVFDKRVILFGSEGSVKVYTSDGEITTQADQPVGVVEAVDPIALSMQITEKDCATPLDCIPEVPANILAAFPEELVLTDSNRLLYATLGQFSLIRLERDSQLVIPVYNYCFPENECVGTTDDDPCTLFGRIRFPVEEFYPPDNLSTCDSYRSLLQ